jgi:hypothetical protein
MKTAICFLLLCLFFTQGCKKLDKYTKFNMSYTEQVIIPASTGLNLPFNLLTPDVTSNSESTFASNDTRKDLVEEIKLTHMDLSIQKPSDGNFSFLKSISIYIKAEGLAETRIAWKNSISANPGNSIVLDVSGDDLKEYLKKDTYTLRLNTTMDETITSDYTINVHSNFYVDAKVLGQ